MQSIAADGTVVCEAKAGDADRLDGVDSSGFLRSTGKAVDSDRLDGWDSTSFLRTTSKAADSDRLDGMDSSAFIQGKGQAVHGARSIPKNSGGYYTLLTTTSPNLTVAYTCPADLTTNGVLVFINNSSEIVNVFMDNGNSNPAYKQLAANGGRWDEWAAATGEHFTIQVQGTQVATIEVFTVHRSASNDCHTQAQATITR